MTACVIQKLYGKHNVQLSEAFLSARASSAVKRTATSRRIDIRRTLRVIAHSFEPRQKKFIENQLSLFYTLFSEWLNLAEFPDVEEQLQRSELKVFLEGAGAPDAADLRLIENYDCFSGLRAVIRHRLSQGTFEQVKLAAELFNWTIEFGLYLAELICCGRPWSPPVARQN